MKLTFKRSFVIVITLFVVAALAYGIVIAGSPGQERLHRMDEQRLSELQQISSSIDLFYEREGRLPGSLSELQSSRYTYVNAVQDPDTGIPYEYTVRSQTTYELCATFSLPTPEHPNTYYGPAPDFWKHDTGRTCYSLTATSTGTLKPVPMPIK